MNTTEPFSNHDPSSLQTIAYAQLAAIVVLVYDWLTLLDREVEHVWRSEWSMPKILFIISRYGTVLDMLILIAVNIVPHDTMHYHTCNVLSQVTLWSAFFGIFISESILLLRTIAIYSGSKQVVILLSIVYTASIAAGIAINCYFLRALSAAGKYGDDDIYPTLAMCYYVQLSERMYFFVYDLAALLCFEIIVVVLTIWRGFRDFSSGTPLVRVVYRDAVGFFLVLLVLSGVSAFLVHLVNGLMVAPLRTFHSIICCRILLNLRRAASPRGPSTILRSIGLAFTTAPGRETSQAETIRLETHGTRNDEEGFRRRTDEDFVVGSSS